MAYPFAQFDTRTPPAAEGYVPSFLSKLPFVHRSTKGTTGGYRKPPANQLVLETLEPRVLLSADLSFGAATDLTLKYDSLFSEYQLIDDLDDVLSRVSTDAIDGGDNVIDIEGSAEDDRLGFDWATLLGGRSISFTGLGMDTLSVLSDSDMSLTNTQLTVNGLGYTVSGFDAAHLTGGAGDNTLDASGFGGTVRLEGAEGDDTLIGGSGANELIGGAGDDTFQITLAGGPIGFIDGGEGNDTLIASDSDNVWEVTGANQGNLNGLLFAGIENLTGGAGDDLFRFLGGGSISGTIDGAGGINTLDYSAQVDSVSVDLNTGSASGAAGGFSGINKVKGGSAADTLRGLDASSVWTLSGLDTGTVGTTDFSDIENLEGGSVDDTFVIGLDGGLTGTLTGGLGFDELISADELNTWTVDAGDSGTLNALAFYNIEGLVGGSDEDEFLFAMGGIYLGSLHRRRGSGPGAGRGPAQCLAFERQ